MTSHDKEKTMSNTFASLPSREAKMSTFSSQSQLMLSDVKIGNILPLSWTSTDEEGQPKQRLATVIVTANPLFPESPAAFTRDYKIERSNITFYAQVPHTSIKALVAAESCDITGKLAIQAVYQLIPDLLEI